MAAAAVAAAAAASRVLRRAATRLWRASRLLRRPSAALSSAACTTALVPAPRERRRLVSIIRAATRGLALHCCTLTWRRDPRLNEGGVTRHAWLWCGLVQRATIHSDVSRKSGETVSAIAGPRSVSSVMLNSPDRMSRVTRVFLLRHLSSFSLLSNFFSGTCRPSLLLSLIMFFYLLWGRCGARAHALSPHKSPHGIGNFSILIPRYTPPGYT